MNDRPPRLRFAPSPTGFLHVGGARTAIFNYLHARRYGGQMVLRIEDTDVERSRQHHAEQIVTSLQWLGVEWDEGPIYQSDRLPRYRQRANELVESGKAYRCYCTVAELERERAAAEASGQQYRYSGRCRTRAEEPDGSHVIRFRVPPGAVAFRDLIRGDVSFEGALIDDFVLLRSDGNPTYHLSVVVDDVDMAITVVARGDDHLSNTPKHILLFDAFGAQKPQFAHLPLILGSDRKRLSKRTGSTSVEEYQQGGVLPEALFNFLLLLGWSPGGDRELVTRDEAIRLFDLSGVNKASAVFDLEKLYWINSQYLGQLDTAALLHRLDEFAGGRFASADRARLNHLLEMYKPRSRTLRDLADQLIPYFSENGIEEYDADAVKKHLKGNDIEQRLLDVRETFAALGSFEVATSEEALRALAERQGISAGKYIHPLRVALTGKSASPPIFDVAVALGKERTLRRIDELLERLPSLLRN